ncbi:MAG: SDR family oxidoreductase [Duodenibacillus sp.]|nr:SDR family oxidoreductase [Duodenibacillus sp.]
MRVFITGASSGIGLEIARIYAQRGAEVGLVGRSPDKLARAAGALAGGPHRTYACDVNDRQALFAAARDFIAGGPVDLVIACAGISVGVKIEYEEDLDVLQKVYRTNVFAMADTFHPFIGPMRRAGAGRLVGIASVSGIRGLPGSEAYCSSKAAVISFLESLRGDMRKHGVGVTTISPGWVRTPLVGKNPYKMPFILEADEFARRAVAAIDAGAAYRTIPWQMGVLAKILRMLPEWLFDRCVAGRGEKPRAGELGMQ